MKTRIRSIIALLLVLCVSMSLFACNKTPTGDGDGDEPGNTPNNQQKTKLTNVYKQTAVALGENSSSMWSAVLMNGRIYNTNRTWDEDAQSEKTELVSISLEDVNDVQTHLSINSNTQISETSYSYIYVGSFAIASDGTIWMVVEESFDDYTDPDNPIYEYTTGIRQYSPEGEVLTSITTKDLMPDAEYAYVNNLAIEGNTLYINCSQTIVVADATSGEVLFKIQDDVNYFSNVMPIGDGEVVVFYYDSQTGNQVLKKIDPVTKSLGEEVKVNTEGNVYFDQVMQGDGDYLLYYYSYTTGIMGLKKDGTVEEIVNFINSDIDSDSVSKIMKLENGEFLMIGYDYETYESKAYRLTEVPEDEIKEAIILTYASMYTNYQVKRKIIQFNKSNGEYRIQIRDYSQYSTNENWNAGYDRLNADIIGGDIPDMMSLEGLDYQNYINKGILADMYALMESSTVADKSDYIESVLKADEHNGKLYRFVPQFAINCLVGKKSIVGDREGWTIDELNALIASIPGSSAFRLRTRGDVLSDIMMFTLDQYIDWETGTCTFDESFIKLLEFAAEYPTEIDWDSLYEDPDFWSTYETDFKENKTLFDQSYVSGFRSVRDYEYQFAEDVAFVGFPTATGVGGSVFYPYSQHGISAAGKNQQVCFDFLASLVETKPNFENAGGMFYGTFSLSKSYMDAWREYELTPVKQRPGYVENGNDDYPVYDIARASARSAIMPMPEPNDPDGGEVDYYADYHLTAEEVAMIDRLIENTTSFRYVNEPVQNIILEEAEEYFAGRRSVDDTVRNIQSRVSILVSESM